MPGILMVGLGGVGQRHLRNLRILLGPDAEISAYRVLRNSPVLTDTLKVEAGSDLEQKYNVTTFSSLDEALARKPLAVFICNPSSLHVPIALAAAEAGCHLFIEKPLSHSLEGIGQLARIVAAKNLVAMVGYQMRFHPCLQRVKTVLDSGQLGRVVAVHAEVGAYMPNWHTYEDYRTSYAARADLGGGVVLSQIHEIDYLGWLFGTPSRVFALGGHLSNLEVDVEDVASSLLECHVDGRLVPIELHQDYLQRPPSRTLRIAGDKGKLLMDVEQLTVTTFDETGKPSSHEHYADFQRNQLFIDEISHFLDCIKRNEVPSIPLADGASSLATALAIKESLATGQPVPIASIQ
jgi:predicted dehydrogenase